LVFDKLRSLFSNSRSSVPCLPPAEELADDRVYSIDDALRDHFAPVMRRLGFKGSGRNFRRVSGDVFQAINVQGSRYGGMFAVNLGIHPLAIPDFVGKPIDVKKSKEIDCDFRRRLSENGCDFWWNYLDTRQSVIEAATAAARAFESHGLPLFDNQAASDGPLFTITPEQFDCEGARPLSGFAFTKARMALSLARLRKAQGKLEECRAFARIGLRPVPPPDLSAFGDRATVFVPESGIRWRGEAELEALSQVGL